MEVIHLLQNEKEGRVLDPAQTPKRTLLFIYLKEVCQQDGYYLLDEIAAGIRKRYTNVPFSKILIGQLLNQMGFGKASVLGAYVIQMSHRR